MYRSGVMDFKKCNTTLNHALVVVGYGTTNDTNIDYWLIKNSWGTDWGDLGYFKFIRNMNDKSLGLCGIYTMPNYPTMN